MLQGLFILAALFAIWFELRHPSTDEKSAFSSYGWRRLDAVLLLLVAFTNLDLLPVLRATRLLPDYLPGDSSTHALVAMHLFDSGWFPQWSESYVGGFPVAIHYPVLGWLLIALPMKLGASPTSTTLFVGYLTALSIPLLFYYVARKNGASLVSSLLVALFLQWFSPRTPFIGNVEVFATSGLLSQAVCMPFILLWGSTLFGKGSASRVCYLEILCVLSHPQITASAALIFGFGVVVTRNGALIRRYVLTQTIAIFVAACVYGPGLATMRVPFGWPDLVPWLRFGFGPEKLYDWLVEGDLLDHNRPPLLTALWLSSVLLLVSRSRSNVIARVSVAISVVGFTLCISGPTLARAGNVGTAIVSVFQPLRTMACLPLVVASTILVTFELYRETPRRIFERLLGRLGRRHESFWQSRSQNTKCFVLLIGSFLLWFPILQTMRSSRAWTFALWTAEFRRYTRERPCGCEGPTRREITAPQQRLATLRSGRLWIDKDVSSTVRLCTLTAGLERYASVPIASTDAVGAHVGVLQIANLQLEPNEAGLLSRAEALGIRYLLLNQPLEPAQQKGFTLSNRFGLVFLYERITPFDYFGVGCVQGSITGPSNALLPLLINAVHRPDGRDKLVNSRRLTAIEFAKPVTSKKLVNACNDDPSFLLREHPHSVGSYAAQFTSESPVEIVLRATAHPGWRFRANGRTVTPHLVTPGYYALNLGPGRYTVEATFHNSPFVPVGFAFALLFPLLLRTRTRAPNNLKGIGRFFQTFRIN